jgi:hypothetical protein
MSRACKDQLRPIRQGSSEARHKGRVQVRQRFGTGPGEVIVTNRLGTVAQRNSFGDRWRLAVADARTCGKPSAPPFEGGGCSEYAPTRHTARRRGRGSTEQRRNQETR